MKIAGIIVSENLPVDAAEGTEKVFEPDPSFRRQSLRSNVALYIVQSPKSGAIGQDLTEHFEDTLRRQKPVATKSVDKLLIQLGEVQRGE